MLTAEELQRLKAGYVKMFCPVCRRETWWKPEKPKVTGRKRYNETYLCEGCGSPRTFKLF